MNNIEKNALRIAELMKSSSNGQQYCGVNRDKLIKKFSSYKYLMPIVFECNGRNKDRIDIGISRVSLIYVNYVDFTKKVFSYNFFTEPEFIEAIQLAVIKYLELKNGE